MKIERVGGPADLTDWSLESLDALSENIQKYISDGARKIAEEAIDICFTRDDVDGGVDMPSTSSKFSGPPLTVRVSLDLDGGPAFQFNFAELVIDEFRSYCTDQEQRDRVISALESLLDNLRAIKGGPDD